ncbi:FtsW/RodA/SpoVE family cell cycle protein [uncultured Fusobacterium sp.]|uniref:FtsW/RodA/SpoVE family cell cycle protein n=1 Tax=uncultured Fusobacterium sp. TaxID=159267 RepID=UPI002589E1A7|nr:FtsW/RodA/SpoVE family cell cycle protein [uncultured Fusobacterium sp.]
MGRAIYDELRQQRKNIQQVDSKLKKNKNERENIQLKIKAYERETQINYLKLEEEKNRKRRNFSLLAMVFLILLVSEINMMSASFFDIYNNGFKAVWSHLLYIFIGLFACIFCIFFPYKKYNRNKTVGKLFMGSILIFLFVIIFGKYLSEFSPFIAKLVPKVNGAIGWIRIGGFSIQPAEILKIPYIIVLAHAMEITEREKYGQIKLVVFLGVIIAIYMLLIIWQEDLGTSLHYLCIFVFMLFMTRFSIKWIIGISIGLLSVITGFFYYVYSLEDTTTMGYKIGRVGSFLNGLIHNEYDNLYGYQVWQSLLAFGSGGILGKGYANGVQKYSYLPEVRTDFILASFGEEFGFVGMMILLFTFFMIFTIIKRIAMNTKDYFGKYLAIGIAGYIITQALINISVAIGLLPVFGIPMPLFSYGGTSLVTVLAAIGIALNINNQGYK